MTSDEKIGEAERWLTKIRNSEHRKNRIELEDNIKAFLNSVNSIPDHLLEEYNKKFNLGINLENKLYPKSFEKIAKQNGNQDALDFISTFKEEKGKVESDPIGKTLIPKRDLDTHRERQKPNKLVSVVGGLKDQGKDFSVNYPELSGNIDDSCKKLLDLMKNFVAEMRRKFPCN